MSSRFRAKLRTLLFALLALTALPALGVVLHSAWVGRQETLDDASRNTIEEATRAAQRLGAVVDEARRVLSRLAATPAVQDGDAAGCAATAADMLEMHPSFRNIGAVRPDGTIYCSGDPARTAGDRTARDLVAGALASPGLLLREFPAGSLAPQPVLATLLPVRNGSGRATGVVFATLDFRALADLTIGQSLPWGSTVTLVDARGEVVVREPDRESWMGANISDTPLWQALQVSRAGGQIAGTDLEGTNRLFGFARIETGGGQPDGFLVVGVQPDVVTARPGSHLRVQLTGLALALLLLVGVTWFGLDALVLRPVHGVASAARELAAGHLQARTGGGRGAHELAQLGRAFDEMAESMERSAAETRHALDVLRDSQSRLAVLSRALLEGQEAERSQLARELHDEVGQALTAATIDLDALRSAERDAESIRRVQSAIDVVKRALEQVRDLSLDLHPSILDDLGLAPALKWYLTKQSQRSAVDTQLRTAGLDERLPRQVETACFRIAQEAITNALRHARPRRIDVDVERTAEAVQLRVRDDGFGFDAEQARLHARQGASLGLLGMEERAVLLGGKLEIESRAGQGTEVRATIPLGADVRAGAAA